VEAFFQTFMQQTKISAANVNYITTYYLLDGIDEVKPENHEKMLQVMQFLLFGEVSLWKVSQYCLGQIVCPA